MPTQKRFVQYNGTTLAAHTIHCVPRSLRPARLLVVNETRLFSLRAGLGAAGDRYGLEHLPAESVPAGAEFVSCKVVPTRRGDVGGSGGSLRRDDPLSSPMRYGTRGMVCLAMLTPPSAGFPQPDRAAKPPSDAGCVPGLRPPAPSSTIPAATDPHPACTALLNVYHLGGERRFEVERALQRQPQQLPLSYSPAGVAHATVWRNVAPPSVDDAATPSFADSYRRRVERGDAVLVWDQDGVVHGYTRWGGFQEDDARIGGDGSSGVVCGGAVLAAESRESLEALIPELRGIDGPVLSLSVETVIGGGGARRRQVMAGCADGVHRVSLDVSGGRTEATVGFANGPVSAVALNTRPRLLPFDRHADDSWGGDVVAGFACTRLGMVAWLVEGGTDAVANEESRWATDSPPLSDADKLICIGCDDFCRDGSTSVAVGTYLGKVKVYSAAAGPDAAAAAADTREDLEEAGGADQGDQVLGATWVDDDEPFADAQSRQGDSTSPRPSGTDRHYRANERPGGRASTGSRLLERWQRDVPHPVFGIVSGDFNHDGVNEMVVVTQYGVHVFRPDYRKEASRLAKTLHALKMLQPEDTDSVASRSDDDAVGVPVLGVEIHNVGAAGGAHIQ